METYTLIRMMKRQLEIAKKVLGELSPLFHASETESREKLDQLKHDISNCLAIVEAEARFIKRG